MKIHIIQEDIDRGIQRSCEVCPISLAAFRAFSKIFPEERLDVTSEPGVLTVEVLNPDLNTVSNRGVYKMPDDMVTWMEDFDDGKDVKPTTFEVRLMSDYHKRWNMPEFPK